MIIPVESIDQLQVETQNEAIKEQAQQEVPVKEETIVEQKQQEDVAPRKKHQRKSRKKGRERGEEESQDKCITPKSPTIYLLKEEKVYLDRLKAFILLETGDKTPDHELVITAVKEYAGKHYKEFADKF